MPTRSLFGREAVSTPFGNEGGISAIPSELIAAAQEGGV